MQLLKDLTHDSVLILRPDIAIYPHPDTLELVVDISGFRRFGLRPSEDTLHLLKSLLPLFDGINSYDDVVRRCCKHEVEEEYVIKAVEKLYEWGFLCDVKVPSLVSKGGGVPFMPQMSLFAQYSSRPGEIQERLANSSVVVAGVNHLGIFVVEALARSGVGEIRGFGNGTVSSAEIPFYGREAEGKLHHEVVGDIVKQASSWCKYKPFLSGSGKGGEWEKAFDGADFIFINLPVNEIDLSLLDVNKYCIQLQLPSLRFQADGSKTSIGPLVVPGNTACYRCMVEREKHYDYEKIDKTNINKPIVVPHSLPMGPLPHLMASAFSAAGYVVEYLAGLRSHTLINMEISIDYEQIQVNTTRILKLPRCPDCSRLVNVPEEKAINVL